MKRIVTGFTALVLVLSLLSACAQEEAQEPQPALDAAYEFELEDINGNVHRLSDYAGKPVFLRVWASWCGVCIHSLPELDLIAGEAEDFVVLTAVMPSFRGEMSREDFAEWFSELGYENIVVLFDDEAKLNYDFGIRAYPTQLLFDAQGNLAYGVPGLMSYRKIVLTMQKIAEQN